MNSQMSAGDWLVSTVKKNPEGLLLLAAGCALLMRSGGRSSQRRSSERIRYPEGDAQPGSSNRRSGASATGEALSGVTEGAQ